MDHASTAVGLALALAAAGCTESGYVLQAGATRAQGDGAASAVDVPGTRRPLLARLAVQGAWQGGTALVVAGIALQLAALGVAPVAVVQPALVVGLGLLVVLAERRLGERVTAADRLGVAAAAAGAALVAIGGAGGTSPPSPGVRAIALGGLSAVVVVAWAVGGVRVTRHARALVVAAGAGDALAVLAAKLLVDDLTAGEWMPAAGWALLAAVGGLTALAAEMRALQHLAATTVGPLVLAAQAAVPVILAPAVVGEDWRLPGLVAVGTAAATGAALVLGRRRETLAAPGD